MLRPRLPMENPIFRRAVTVPAVGFVSGLLGSTAPAWTPLAVASDLLGGRPALPRARLLTFGWAWSTLEVVGVAASAALWGTGRSSDDVAHYALQRWWAARLVDALGLLADLRFEVDDLDALRPGPIVIGCSHASVADALLPAWLVAQVEMRPRYVLKRELLVDPCLDIVGNRLPNHFLDRNPGDRGPGIDAIRALATKMGSRDAAIIYPEGVVTTPAARTRMMQRLADRDPQRSERLRGLQRLAPPQAGGLTALLDGCPDADLVLVGHAGLEALQRVADAPANVPLAEPVRVTVRRTPRAALPDGADFGDWLDQQWLELDGWIDTTIAGA